MAARAIVDHPLTACNGETIRPAPVTPSQDAPSSYGTTAPAAATPASPSTHTEERPPRQTQTFNLWNANQTATRIPSRRVSFNIQTQKRPMSKTPPHTTKRRHSNPEISTAPTRNAQRVSDAWIQQWKDEQWARHLIRGDEERLRNQDAHEQVKARRELVELGVLIFLGCLLLFAWWAYNSNPQESLL